MEMELVQGEETLQQLEETPRLGERMRCQLETRLFQEEKTLRQKKMTLCRMTAAREATTASPASLRRRRRRIERRAAHRVVRRGQSRIVRRPAPQRGTRLLDGDVADVNVRGELRRVRAGDAVALARGRIDRGRVDVHVVEGGVVDRRGRGHGPGAVLPVEKEERGEGVYGEPPRVEILDEAATVY